MQELKAVFPPLCRLSVRVVPGVVLTVLAGSAWAQEGEAAGAQPVAPPAPSQVVTPEAVTAPPVVPEAASEPSAFESSVAWGVGIRTWASVDTEVEPVVAEDGSLGADPDDPQFFLGYNVRPYVMGAVHENIKFEGNLDSDGSNIRLLDAVLKFEFNDLFNVWAGHFLPPTDRANLSGPYFQNAFGYPTGQHIYPSGYAGRNDGIAYWGMVGGGAFKWQVGVFDLAPSTAKPRVAGRLTLNLLDPEPGYYNSSTYYGTKDILAVGLVAHYLPDAVAGINPESATLYSVDALYENNLGGAGTLTLEPAFYAFGALDQGNSFSVLASFLLPQKVGFGQLQPMVRWQQATWSEGESFNGFAGPDGSSRTVDVSLNWIIDGHNAKLSANWQNSSIEAAGADAVTDTVFTLAAQIQRF